MSQIRAQCWLVADIGGTHARFGLSSPPGRTVTDIQVMQCADHPDPQTAALAYLARLGRTGAVGRPRRAALAIACTIDADPVKMTNGPWLISSAQIGAALALDTLNLLNDFEAVAHALPLLGPGDL